MTLERQDDSMRVQNIWWNHCPPWHNSMAANAICSFTMQARADEGHDVIITPERRWN